MLSRRWGFSRAQLQGANRSNASQQARPGWWLPITGATRLATRCAAAEFVAVAKTRSAFFPGFRPKLWPETLPLLLFTTQSVEPGPTPVPVSDHTGSVSSVAKASPHRQELSSASSRRLHAARFRAAQSRHYPRVPVGALGLDRGGSSSLAARAATPALKEFMSLSSRAFLLALFAGAALPSLTAAQFQVSYAQYFSGIGSIYNQTTQQVRCELCIVLTTLAGQIHHALTP